MANAGIRGEVRLDTNRFAEDVKRVARGAGQAKESIEGINQADLSPLQKRINEMFDGGSRRYSPEDLFSRQQRSFAVGNFGDMRNLEGFQSHKTEAELRRIARAAGKQPGGAGMAMLELGRAAEDAQYGIAGALNNLGPMLMSLGVRAGPVGIILAALAAGGMGGKKLYDWANRTKDVADATAFNDKMAKQLADTLQTREKEAINGSIAGRAKLEAMSRASAQAYQIEAINAQRNIAVQAAIADARTNASLAKIEGDGPEAAAKRGAIEIEAVQAADAAKVAAIEAELARNRRLTKAAEDHASAVANAAKRAAQDVEELGEKVSEDGRRLARIKATELEADARQAKERAEEVARDEYNQMVRLIGEKEAVTKTANDRIFSMAKGLQDDLANLAKDRAQAEIDAYNSQMDRHIAWKEQVDETIAKEKEKEKQSEAARQKERDAIAARIIINQARARGDEEEVKELEKKVRIMNQIQALRDRGFTQEEASALANAEADSETGRRTGRNGRPRIGRPGRGKIGAGGIDGGGDWQIDRNRQLQRTSLRDQLDREIGSIGGDEPKQRRVTTTRETGGASKLDAAIARMSATLDSIDKSAAQLARKAAMAPMSSGGERNYVALP